MDEIEKMIRDEGPVDRLLLRLGLVRASRHRQLMRAYRDVWRWWTSTLDGQDT